MDPPAQTEGVQCDLAGLGGGQRLVRDQAEVELGEGRHAAMTAGGITPPSRRRGPRMSSARPPQHCNKTTVSVWVGAAPDAINESRRSAMILIGDATNRGSNNNWRLYANI